MALLLQSKYLLLGCLWSNVACTNEYDLGKAKTPSQAEESNSANEEQGQGENEDPREGTQTNQEECDETDNTQDTNTKPDTEKPEEVKPTKPKDKPKKTKAPVTKPEYSRANPPPRAQFAKSDLDILDHLFYGPDIDLPKAYKKLAEIFHYDGFRAIPTQFSSETPQVVLLLGYSIDHLADTINFLAGLAHSINEEGSAADKRKLRLFYPIQVVSLEEPKPDIKGRIISDNSKIQIQISKEHSKFIKEIPLSSKMQKYWPEALQLEISFGSDTLRFIFPSAIIFSQLINADLLQGKTLMQTPWILRALEGERLSALWQAVSKDQVDTPEQQTGTLELLYKIVMTSLFESVWDARSTFFPKHNAFRIVDRFHGPVKKFLGSTFHGHQELKFETLGELRTHIAALMKEPGFRFENK